MKLKRLIAAVAVMALTFSFSVPAFAATYEYFLDNGNITISANEGGQSVTQDNKTDALQNDDVINITQKAETTSNTIEIKVSNEATANVTIKDVNIETSNDAIKISTSGDATANITLEDVDIKSEGKGYTDAIYIANGSNVEITLEGTNKLYSESGSAIHIAKDSDLTIASDEDDKGSLEAKNGGYGHAAIGSYCEEHMSSEIHITGNSTVTAKSDGNKGTDYGASSGIGAGNMGGMTGSITIDGDAQVTAEGGNRGTGIGSGGSGGAMSGDITIGGNAQVTATGKGNSAGIGSGYQGKMSGTITISDDAQVTAQSDGNGAGIGSGASGVWSAAMTSDSKIIIDGNAQVTAWSKGNGAGIGSGSYSSMTGKITIGDEANVVAWSAKDGAGIGSGSSITSTGTITIEDKATVTAGSNGSGAGIGSNKSGKMDGIIIIQDEAEVTAIAGSSSAIGSGSTDKVTGIVVVHGDAKVVTGVSSDGISYDSKTKQITYTLKDDAIGIIGDGANITHTSNTGHYVLGLGAEINKNTVSGTDLNGSDIQALQDYINMYLSGEDHNGEPQNLTLLQVSEENGAFSVKAYGEGHLGKIFYDGKEEVPTDPGKYSVTIELTFDDGKAVTLKVGTMEIPDPNAPTDPGDSTNPGDKNDPEDKNDPTNPTTPTDPTTPGEELVDLVNENTASEPLYRVTNKNGWDIVHKAERKNGVLTITVNEDYANLTGALSGISTLEAQGVEKIVFVTNEATSAFKTADLLKQGGSDTTYKFTHNGAAVTFVVGSTDVSGILIK